MSQVIELPIEEKVSTGCSHCIKVDHTDLTETTANTAQAINIPLAAGYAVGDVGLFKLKTPFRNSADAAHNTTTLSIGDNASATTWRTAAELNANGSKVDFGVFTATTGKAYTAADTVKLTFGSMSAKNLAALNEGEVHLFVQLINLNKAS